MVRHGDVIVHCALDQVEDVTRALRKAMITQVAVPELMGFTDALVEIVAGDGGCQHRQPGAALRAARGCLGASLTNEVRQLMRARGAAAHQIPPWSLCPGPGPGAGGSAPRAA